MVSLWLVDPATMVKPAGGRRKIRRKPLIDLAGLQQAIKSGQLEDDDVWLGTGKVERNLEDLTWTFGDVLDCIACLSPDDHRGAEWCEDRGGHWHPCDAYAIRYDDVEKRRIRRCDFSYYLKFSLNEDGALTLVLISCHLSQ